MDHVFANKAATLLESAFSSVATVLTLTAGEGALFPSTAGGKHFDIVLEDRLTGLYEIARCTSRTGDSLTLSRAQEGTTARTWAAGTQVSHRTTAGFYTELIARMNAIEQAATIPVGGLYLSTVATNPSGLLGYGTWSAYAAGRALVGVGNNGESTWAGGDTRGSEEHTLVSAEMPAHTHGDGTLAAASNGTHTHGNTLSVAGASLTGTIDVARADINGETNWIQNETGIISKTVLGSGTQEFKLSNNNADEPMIRIGIDATHGHSIAGSISSDGAHTHDITGATGSTGGGDPHNNIQPSIAIYVWRRTA